MFAASEGGIPWTRIHQRLSAFGIGPAHFAELVQRACAASSLKANPVPRTDQTTKSRAA